MKKNLLIFLSLLCASCNLMMPMSTSLKDVAEGNRIAEPLEQRVWIGRVTINDPVFIEDLGSLKYIDKPVLNEVEGTLKTSVAGYIDQKNYFSVTNTLPGKPVNDDLIFDIEFTRYQHRRRLPWYTIPAAAITLAWYLVLGGTVDIDTHEYAATLTVRDAQQHIIFNVSDAVIDKHRITIYDGPYETYSFETRTKLIDQLLKKAIDTLRNTP